MRLTHAKTLLVTASLVATGFAITVPAQYLADRQQGPADQRQNEPQNWLLMNGDYGSLRYSKLTQINRENVKNLRMVWAMALGGMQDVGQNGPENEVNPLIDNGFMYTSDGWGTIYKIDARNPDRGKFVWVADPGVPARRQRVRARAASRCGKTRSSPTCPTAASSPSTATTARSSGTRRSPTKNEFGGQERFLTAPLVADGKVIIQNGAGDGGTRGWVAALDVKTGNELWRWYTVPKPGDPGSETWKDDHNAWKTGGGGIWQTGSYDPAQNLYIVGTGNPVPDLRPAVPSGRQPLHQLRRRARTSPPASWRGTSSTRRTTRGTTTRSACTCSTTRRSTACSARSWATTRATASSTRSIAPTAGSSRPRSTSTI